MPDFCELIEAPPVHGEAIARLFSWSTNYGHPTPAELYLDLIGYSQDELGETLCGSKLPAIGYLGAGLLGEALTAFADYPSDVWQYVHALAMSELEA